ncbi:ribitol-5-phosphate xylosyltransferase 1-like isoform X2 [Patiria miniata]|uniref:Transmembrane protein 5 n=1 Tax=Patiria miniata TaxID=46514 RepID=A0A913ZSV2_PATMI|nr:ribitol-5-phosphate xylosyltransferase 1-like isoform X2 [Patiria miniata]
MRPRLTLKRLSWLILSVYLLCTCYGAYVLLSQKASETSQSGKSYRKGLSDKLEDKVVPEPVTHKSLKLQRETETRQNLRETKDNHGKNVDISSSKENAIEIWSRAGVGQYTWEHILGASVEPRLGGVWSYGRKTEGNITFTFRMGPGVLPNKVPTEVENLLLVLNGRAPDKVEFTRTWLDYLDAFPQLRNVALMLIGSEQCDNDWVLPYMASRGGPLRFLLVVYDTPLVDDAEIYQWPLGVATYRGFPVVDSAGLNVRASRPYRCNFMGTIYPNSSRETLLRVIKKHNLGDYCYVRARESWEPAEKEETRLDYERILSQSDLTLSPVGLNTESYRIYEACSYGSVPVIEDVKTSGRCAREPLRLLKRFQAPFIFLKDWNQLPEILKEESRKTPQEIYQRREELLRWYDNFRAELKQVFLKTIQGSFFPT